MTRQEKKNELKRVMRMWFREYKSGLQCETCGENHPATISFHHRNPDNKYMSVCHMIRNRNSKARILAEIAKCAILCANCHAKLHYDDEWNNPPPAS